MPAAPAAPPAAAPAAGVTIVEGAPPKPVPAPTTAIHVSAMPSSEPGPPPKKGSAREAMRQALRKSAGEEPEPAPATLGKRPDFAATKAADAPPERGEPGHPDSPPSPEATSAGAPQAPAKKEKANPWRLYEAEKQARGKVEAEFQEYRSKVPRDVDVRGLADRAEKAERLATQFADEIRYHAYEKSPEFHQHFQAPYEAAFRRAMEDLKEVTILDPQTNQPRQFSGEDLAQISFMTLAQAKEVATRLFPDFADDIMASRKEIRSLWEKRQEALKQWKETGTQRSQAITEALQKHHQALASEVQTHWTKANEELVAHQTRGEYFRPREGDTEWNDRLEKGYKLADEAFATNLLDRNLTAEQRAAAVNRYAAVRARAASWGPLRHQNETLKGRVAELEAELKQYKESTPPAGGTEGQRSSAVTPGSARARLSAELQKRAH